MGCGRGAVLTAAARRLTTGRVTGVDIWSTKDQSGNAKSVTLRNAEREGVNDRVRIETSDMRQLPYADATSTWWSRAWRYTTFARMPSANQRGSKVSVRLGREAGW
jgi:hypothetical protein